MINWFGKKSKVSFSSINDWFIATINEDFEKTSENNLRIQLLRNSAITELKADFHHHHQSINEQYQDYIRSFIDELKTKLTNKENPRNIENEVKAVEWLKGTLVVLNGAIEKSIHTSDLRPQVSMFLGRPPKEDGIVMRFLCFHLDFNFSLDSEGHFFVQVYDQKDSGNSPLKLNMQFQQMNFQLFDLVIELLSSIGKLWQFESLKFK